MRIMRAVAPRHAEAAERESREWFLICRECGHTRTFADIGAIRYGASSKGKTMGYRCPACDGWRTHTVERRREPAAAESSGY